MDIKGVEIFSVGTWNDQKFTVEDIKAMAEAFSETGTFFKPYAKLGHDKSQAVAKKIMETDGDPALGWVSNMYTLGNKLMADFTDIPVKIFELIQKKAYRKVSIELFNNAQIGEKVYKRLVGAVAFLGAENPGVMDLADILSCYKKICADGTELMIFSNGVDFNLELETPTNKGEPPMAKTEQEIKLELELAAQKQEFANQAKKVKDLEDAQAAKDKRLADADAKVIEFAKKESEALAKAEDQRIENFASQLVTDMLCTPAMKPLVKELLNTEKKEFSVKIKDDKEEKLSREELLKHVLKLFKAAAEVNFKDNSKVGDAGGKDDDQDETDKKAKAYAKDNNCSYSKALKHVLNEKKNT